MTGRTKFWLAAAAVFAAGNIGFAVFVVVAGEFLHAAGHLALAIPAAYAVRRIVASHPQAGSTAETAAVSGALDGRLSSLERSIDAVALEVERIGEGQRFMTRLFAEDDGARPRRPADAELVGNNTPV